MKLALFALVVILNVFDFAQQGFCSQALKKTIAVVDFENGTGWGSGWSLGSDFATQLSDALVQSGKFIVLTRENLGNVLMEQDLSQSDRFAKAETVQTGKVIPAQILVKGKITEFKEDTQDGNQNLSFHGVSLNTKRSSAHIAIIVQLFNSSTGEIIDSKRVEGEAVSTGATIGASTDYYNGMNFRSESFKSTALGKSMQIIIDRCVDYIGKKLTDVSWNGKVILVKEGMIYINSGKNVGIKNDDLFDVYHPGESLIDPDTGMELGSENKKIGKIKIVDVKDKFSTAVFIEGGASIVNKGDIVL